MADPVSYGNPERDIEQALIALKKGTQLIKYSRKGKPKFRPFRVSTDETTLIWYSHGEERNLNLSSVTKIIPGQRTAVFRRYPRPDKDYLSFSLVYNNGERSLDLICKDKVETEVWFAGLKTLISPGQRNRHTKSEIPNLHDGGDFLQTYRPFSPTLEATSSLNRAVNSKLSDFGSREPSLNFRSSDVGSDRANMQLRASTGDGVRLSVSSAPSSSSQGSGPDDIESLGDIYVWGEVWRDGNSTDGFLNQFPSKVDVLLPKPLESDVVLDVHQIACGIRHAALVTRQGEVFTWGEEAGGRLGHGTDRDFSRPRLVEFLAVNNMDLVACGEYHTCAVTMAGDFFTWGDGTYNSGLLGHGTDVSHWIPKRITGPIEGLQILAVACGTWHTALVTSNGKLFTFGDGTFGVLGHGSRESIACPREVESLSGLKTVKVACGVWHTAAIIEVMGQPGAHISSRKLFTWGDGDKYRLGHGDKEPRLVPTCVPSLIDYNFHQLACGHHNTVALTTSGHVFTMGSNTYGQLGNPLHDGKLPCLVQDKLVGEFVEEISCGAFHIAVLTSRSEVFTWGRGANGRLGHGDIDDRKGPTLIEALKERHVKSISCGSNFTASICIHKWVSGADQSVCTGCRQAFGFTRKRHNCYNCGLVHCHACSSKKALRAALAPTPGKPHRVCDSCYSKLKATESGGTSNLIRKSPPPRQSFDGREQLRRGESRSSKMLLSPGNKLVRYVDVKSIRQGMKSDSLSTVRVSPVPSLFQLKDLALTSSLTALQFALKPVITAPPIPQVPQPPPPLSSPQPAMTPRTASPYTRKPSPPRNSTPTFSRSVVDSLKKTNELLNQEVLKLQREVKSLKHKLETQDDELEKSQKKTQEAVSLAAEESSKCTMAQEIIKSVASQFKDMTENLSPEVFENEDFKAMQIQLEKILTSDGNDLSEISYRKRDHTMIDSGYGTTSGEDNRRSVDDPSNQSLENGSASSSATRNGEEKDITEQFESGVYVTYFRNQNGDKMFRRVRFSKKRYSGKQAEEWWEMKKDRVLQRYKPSGKEGE